MPLVYGLGNSTCESQRAAMMLAERIGAVIDSHTSLTHGPSKIAAQLAGKLTCTPGEAAPIRLRRTHGISPSSRSDRRGSTCLPGEFTAVDVLARREADAALIVAADPWTTMPQAALDHLDRIPHIVIDRKVTAANLAARVHFTTAAPGISSAGTAYRMDRIPLPVRPVLRSPHATDEDVLRSIHALMAT